ncbi:hypothetical protein ACFQL1_10215 [Halomicroarcula sp. GCM10025709]|uniref:DUF7856 family protein n=1 Tax=Haloarcula TaxID=2237 RepID=UPI0024C26BF1|nr:hypothetical protein [Halomicroarcula sp. YJ-61-S]
MRLTVGATTYEGRVVDLRARSVDGRTVAAAVRGERCLPAVDAPEPTAVYDAAGYVHPDLGLRTRTALAAAARSAGHTTPEDGAIEEVRERLADIEPAVPDRTTRADAVPEHDLAALQESVGVHRGRVRAREALDADTEDARADLEAAAATLAERRTARTAAEQSRRRRREELRTYRDHLAQRRRLEDRLANRQRAARATLVERLRPAFETAVADAPGPTPTDPFDAEPVTAALAVLRVASTPAPVVLSVDRFTTPAAAAAWLDAPVVRC